VSIKYSKSIITKAKELFYQGQTYAAIAKTLGIKRPMTIFDWAKKFSWVRNNQSTNLATPEAQDTSIETFQHVLKFTDNIIKVLQEKLTDGLLEPSDLVKIMDKLPNLIKNLNLPAQASSFTLEEITDKDQDEKPKKGILRFLGLSDGG